MLLNTQSSATTHHQDIVLQADISDLDSVIRFGGVPEESDTENKSAARHAQIESQGKNSS